MPSGGNRFLSKVASWFDFGRDMHLIVISGCAANIVFFANFQYIPMYIRSLGGSIENLGVFFVVGTCCNAVFVIIGGWLVDRYNRKILFSLTPMMVALSSLLLAVAPSWPWLLPGMAVSMLGSAIGGPIFFSMTSDLAPRDRRAAFFGYQSVAWSLSSIIGPLAGGIFYQYLNYRWFLLLGAGLAFAASYLRSLIHDPRDNPDWVPEGGHATGDLAPGAKRRGIAADFVANFKAFGQWALKTPGIVPFMVAMTIPAFGAKIDETYLAVFLNEAAGLVPATIGILVAVSGAFSIPANLTGGRFGDAVGRRVAAPLAFLLIGFWLCAATVTTGMGPFVSLYAVNGLINGGLFPSVDAWHADVCPSRHRGTYRGVLSLMSVLIAIPAPLAGSWLWDHLGAAATIQTAGGIQVLTALSLLAVAPLLGHRRRRNLPGARSVVGGRGE